MSDDILQPPRKLAREDDRSTFTSGAPELDDWFRRIFPGRQIDRPHRF